jgi:anthranilate synthase component 1
MDIAPGFTQFASAYEKGLPQALHARLVADLETPVSAFLKLAEGRENALLLESVQGGEARGRYSIICLKPDLIWRCRDGKAEINRSALSDPSRFAPDQDAQAPLVSLKRLVREARMDLPPGLPPMSAGLFGYLGYDLVRHMERLPPPPPDPLGLPDAIMMRPTIIAIFDNVRDEIIVVTPVWPDPKVDAKAAYARACERLEETVGDLERALAPAAGANEPPVAGPAESNTSHAEYLAAVEKAKEYIRAGDIFQVVPSQRFRRSFSLPPFSLYRALRRLNPSPFLYFLNFPGFAIVGSSPEILVRLREGRVTIRPIAGTRPRGKTPEEDQGLAEELIADPKERAEHLMLLDLGRNDVGRVAETGSVRVTDQFFIERYSHVMHLVSNVEGRMRSDLDAVDALAAGFPAGTLSGLCRRGRLFRRQRHDGHLHRAAYRHSQGRRDVCAGGRRRCRGLKPGSRVPGNRQ